MVDAMKENKENGRMGGAGPWVSKHPSLESGTKKTKG